MLSIHCRLIKYYLIYVRLTLTLAKVCPHSYTITIRDVGRYVEKCNLCQRMKNKMEEPAGKLKLDEMLKKPWSYLTVDFITKLLIVVRKDAILVVCDRLSKIAHFMATIEEMLAERLARLFWDNIWKLHVLPKSIILDWGSQFTAGLMKELNRMLEIKTKLSITFHQ